MDLELIPDDDHPPQKIRYPWSQTDAHGRTEILAAEVQRLENELAELRETMKGLLVRHGVLKSTPITIFDRQHNPELFK